MNHFGNNLKLLIKKKKIPGKEVAERIGKSESTITSYVNGTNPTLDVLIQLCEIFDVDLNTMVLVDLSAEDQKTSEPEQAYHKINMQDELSELRKIIDQHQKLIEEMRADINILKEKGI